MNRIGRPVAGTLVLASAALFTLSGYEIIRSVSNSLFIQAFGSGKLPIVMALGPVGTLAGLYGYGKLLSRVGPSSALVLTTIASGIGILACFAGIVNGSVLAVGVLYVLRESYIVILIEQYWSFINSSLNDGQARTLNGPVCGIASIGSIAGGLFVANYAHTFGTETLLLFAAASLLPAAALSLVGYRVGGEPNADSERPAHGSLGLKEFRTTPVLRNLAFLILLTQLLSTVLDLRFNGLVEETSMVADDMTAFFGNFYARLNLAAFVLQFLGVPVILRLLSLRTVHLAIPCVHLLTCTLVLVHPTLATGAAAYLVFKAIDYSLFRASKEVLYLPLSFDARYRTKEVIDAFGYRASKGVTAGFLAVVEAAIGHLPGALLPVLGLGAGGLWISVANRLVGSKKGTFRRSTQGQEE
jgi:AAA family ATP:ADP antiporter